MDFESIKQDLASLNSKFDILLKNQSAGESSALGKQTQECLEAVRRMQITLQGPSGYLDWSRNQTLNNTAIYFALETGVIKALCESVPEAISATSLAAKTGVREDVVRMISPLTILHAFPLTIKVRLMRMLITVLAVAEYAGQDAYKANTVTQSLNTEHLRMGFAFSQQLAIPIAARFSEYIRATEPGQLGTKEHSPLQFAFGKDLWSLVASDENKRTTFDRYFALTRAASKAKWFDVYPMRTTLQSLSKQSRDDFRAVIVDVGGGHGQDIRSFMDECRDHLESFSKLVLEDLPSVIQGVPAGELDDRVQRLEYDFFKTVQPVQGPHFFFMHDIMHDHSDEDCLVILNNTTKSMWPDTKLLIQDWVVWDDLPQPQAVGVDWTMLTFLGGGRERTLRQWKALLSRAGLVVVKVWELNRASQAVIEVALSGGAS